jgi:hypothetical protein
LLPSGGRRANFEDFWLPFVGSGGPPDQALFPGLVMLSRLAWSAGLGQGNCWRKFEITQETRLFRITAKLNKRRLTEFCVWPPALGSSLHYTNHEGAPKLAAAAAGRRPPFRPPGPQAAIAVGLPSRDEAARRPRAHRRVAAGRPAGRPAGWAFASGPRRAADRSLITRRGGAAGRPARRGSGVAAGRPPTVLPAGRPPPPAHPPTRPRARPAACPPRPPACPLPPP